MKPPDHPVPSGDRQMARSLVRAISVAGHDVEIASRFRTYSSDPALPALAEAAERERARLRRRWHDEPMPELWFTYHPYYRAPDLLGPSLARELRIPYVTAEASYAGKRDRDAWRPMQATVVEAVRSAELNLCLTAIDREGLARIVGEERLADLPPFIDPLPPQRRARPAGGPTALVTVAMMRKDAKLDSYRFLSEALRLLPDLDWTLTVVGDGPARADVRDCFAGFAPSRVRWLGELPGPKVVEAIADAAIFVWPGIGEAYGLVYLEAQAAGLPVVGLDTHGVPSVVRNGETGALTPPGDVRAYADAIKRLIEDGELRGSMGARGRAFVRTERSIEAAARGVSEAFCRVTQVASGRSLEA